MLEAESRWRRVTEWVIAREGVSFEDARDLAQEVAIDYFARVGVEPWNDPQPRTALLYCLFIMPLPAIIGTGRENGRVSDDFACT